METTTEQLRRLERMEGRTEVERKFVPRDPEIFERYRSYADKAVTQVYLSSPEDDFGLRVREIVTDTGTDYSATLKSRGEVRSEGLVRLEVETPISKETFDHYATQGFPSIRKLRAEPLPGVTIDWIEGREYPLVEIEDPALHEEASRFLSQMQDELVELTGRPEADNESIAWNLSGRTPETRPSFSVETILEDIDAFVQAGAPQIVIALSGRSGSGKTTMGRELAGQLVERYGIGPAVLSTDDYHVGKQHLERTYGAPWTNWEAPEVYDTKAMARDVDRLQDDEVVRHRSFDFEREEPVEGEVITPSPFILIEGIHAGSRDLAGVRDIYFEVPTSLATSLGRDLTRIMSTDRPNESIGSPEARLRYILEIGEPTYAGLPSARRNTFSASVRPTPRAD